MPEATQRALQTAEERRAIEAEAALPAVSSFPASLPRPTGHP
ncbi:hypothetical protein DESPIG_01631 [Desulfovibrio piger ATCC 29098]|uniref:Uncharacterized protein n=2 Tax=Desulfovibrio piger TaxID=901 RepID=B6WU73_9BACT|nr:hypothetical protein DESPIG_01631 [Desulfovibrio piger ATCC 29098]